MTHVVAEPCVGCKHTDCVEVCPVDAFREGENCLVIDPDTCIDCTLCVPMCPVDAIFHESDLPAQWTEWQELNARLAPLWPVLTRQKAALPDHAAWAGRTDRRAHLSERPGPGD